jgi:membrane-bound lytic murein transglycosylase A
MLSIVSKAVSFDALPGWHDDDHLTAFQAFSRSAKQACIKPYRDGAIPFAAFKPSFDASLAASIADNASAKRFFEAHFTPVLLKPDNGTAGLVTGFYEPIVEGSRTKTEAFPIPLYRMPDDLIELDDASRPQGFDPSFRFARKSANGIDEYPDRGVIERGYLAGRGLELVYVADKIEAFFIHVQGAARIKFADGSSMGVTYSAKSGHPFSGPGRILIDRGDILERDISMQSIRGWLKANPDGQDELLWQNRSFIFFKESPVEDEALGPVAAAKVQLTPGRSMAVDRLRHVFGAAFYVVAQKVNFGDGKPFQRLMIAQDTGSAILGNARGDLFTGSGFDAGNIAGKIKAEADFYLLLPKALAAQI